MTGLSLSYFLSKKGIKVDLFESEENCGGLASSFKYKGHNVDKFYHHFYTHDDDIIGLIKDIGLGNRIVYRNSPNGMYYANKCWSLSSPLDLLRFKPLSLLDRLRMGMLVFMTQRKKNLDDLADIPAREWLIKNCGQGPYMVMWEPLLKSKFGRFSREISAQWLASKFVKRGSSRSGGGKEALGYLKGGLGIMIGELCRILQDKGVSIYRSCPISSIITDNGQASGITTSSGERKNGYDLVISTLSTELTASLLADSHGSYQDDLKRIKYLANTTLVLFLKKSLSEYYWINVADPSCPFVGVIEHTNLIPSSEYSDLSIVYIPRYLEREDPYFRMSEEQTLDRYLPWLERIFKGFNGEMIADAKVCRDLFTQPVITTYYRKMIPEVRTPIDRLFLVTMAQIYPDDRQLSNSVKHARLFSENFT